MVIAAQRLIVFIIRPGFPELACGELGTLKLVSVEFVKCPLFLVFTVVHGLFSSVIVSDSMKHFVSNLFAKSSF